MALANIANKSIINDAQQILQSIARSGSPQLARMLKAKLINLAGDSGGDRAIESTVYGYVVDADGYIQTFEREMIEEAGRIAAERFILDQDTRKLLDELQKKELFTAEEQAYLNDIKDDKVYKIQKFDENGKAIKGEYDYVTGAELKESAVLIKANKNKDLLSKEARAALNRKLHGHSEDPKSAKDIRKGMETLSKAANRIAGDHFAHTSDPVQQKKIERDLLSFISAGQALGSEADKKDALPAKSPLNTSATALITNQSGIAGEAAATILKNNAADRLRLMESITPHRAAETATEPTEKKVAIGTQLQVKPAEIMTAPSGNATDFASMALKAPETPKMQEKEVKITPDNPIPSTKSETESLMDDIDMLDALSSPVSIAPPAVINAGITQSVAPAMNTVPADNKPAATISPSLITPSEKPQNLPDKHKPPVSTGGLSPATMPTVSSLPFGKPQAGNISVTMR